MAVSVSYTVNGFEFTVTVGTGFSDGIVIEPGTAQPSSPEWANALMELCAAYDVIIEALILQERCDASLRYVDSQGTKHLQECRNNIFELRARTDFYRLPVEEQETLETYASQINSAIANYKAPERKKRVYPNKAGYVYLIQSSTGAYKIGRTKDPSSRSKTFGVQLPFEVEFIATIATADMFALEAKLHIEFDAKRINGEWFALDTSDVEYIKSITGGAS